MCCVYDGVYAKGGELDADGEEVRVRDGGKYLIILIFDIQNIQNIFQLINRFWNKYL